MSYDFEHSVEVGARFMLEAWDKKDRANFIHLAHNLRKTINNMEKELIRKNGKKWFTCGLETE